MAVRLNKVMFRDLFKYQSNFYRFISRLDINFLSRLIKENSNQIFHKFHYSVKFNYRYVEAQTKNHQLLTEKKTLKSCKSCTKDNLTFDVGKVCHVCNKSCNL
jgi:hypothetical protein